LEIPPYHVPSLRVIWWYTRVNTMHFLRKAGVIIFPMVIIFWFLLHIGPAGYTTDYSSSIGAIIGRYISLITSPIGLSDWRASLALLSGFLAKEGVLGTINTITGSEDPVAAIRSILGPAEIVSLSVMMNFYLPCMATAAVLLKELRSAKYLVLVIVYELLVAYLLAFFSYQIFALLFS
jgi:ferrous iron transport protein B